MKRVLGFVLIALALLSPGAALAGYAAHDGSPQPSGGAESVAAQGPVAPVTMRDIGYDPHLDAQLPLDLDFRDETGRAVRLGDYLGDVPVLLSINDFSCEDVCPVELRSLVDTLNQVKARLGADYKALAVSLNPASTTEEANAVRGEVVRRYNRPDAPDGAEGWRFLTGEQQAITALTQAVGLKYAYDERSKSFAHPVGVVLLTPEGRIARYLYGINFPANDVNLALYEASQGKISSPVTPILMLCYRYDAATGRYTNVALTAVRTGGVVTVLGIGAFLGVMFYRDVRGRKDDEPETTAENQAQVATRSDREEQK